jgi:hypothetical protein
MITLLFTVSFQAFGRSLQKSCSSGSTMQARLLYSARCGIQQIQRDSSFPTLCPSQLQSSQLKQAQPTMHSTHHELKASDSDTFNFPSPLFETAFPLCVPTARPFHSFNSHSPMQMGNCTFDAHDIGGHVAAREDWVNHYYGTPPPPPPLILYP